MMFLGILLVGVMMAVAGVQAQTVFEFDPEYEYRGQNPTWFLEASDPLLIGGYGDNFSYDGTKVASLTGDADLLVDVDNNFGIGIVSVRGQIQPEKGKTYSGLIKMVYRFGAEGDFPAFAEGGVVDYIYLHGDSGNGPPVMPKVRAFVAAWGPVDIYVNGELVYNNLDGHIMYTEQVRDPETRAIYTKDMKGFYNPADPGNAYIAGRDRRALHFTANSVEEDPGNFPPQKVWIHLNFQTVLDRSILCPTYFAF
jgi:hypothetical protein